MTLISFKKQNGQLWNTNERYIIVVAAIYTEAIDIPNKYTYTESEEDIKVEEEDIKPEEE